MKVGDRIGHMRPSFGDCLIFDKTGVPGRVVYIHPKRRFYTIEFEFEPGRRCRESFYFKNRSGPENSRKT